MTVEEIKGKLHPVITEWLESRVAMLRQSNPNIDPIRANYINKYLRNFVTKSADKIDGMVDNLIMFAGDENGNIDVDTLLDDAISIIKSGKPSVVGWGPVSVRMGGGTILRMEIDNPIMSFVFGGTTAINIGDADVKDFARMLIG